MAQEDDNKVSLLQIMPLIYTQNMELSNENSSTVKLNKRTIKIGWHRNHLKYKK
jgi:hypothetical protein